MGKSKSLSGIYLAIVIVAVSAATPSYAPAQITYLSQYRWCQAITSGQPTSYGWSHGATPYTDTYTQSAPDTGPFSGTCLTSALNPSSITANGSSTYDPTGGGNLYNIAHTTRSQMEIGFFLTQPVLFTGSLFGSPTYTQSGSIVQPPPGWANQVFSYSLTGPSGQTWPATNSVLPAGYYTLTIGADVGSHSDFNYYSFYYNLNFSVAPLPEPSGVALVGVGTLGVLGRRGRTSVRRVV